MTQNLLDDTTPQIDSVDPDKDYLEELIGPGGKFYDPDRDAALRKLARGKVEADVTVKKREIENSELRKDYISLREEYNAVPKLQELIDQLTSQQLASSDNTLNANEDLNKPAIDMNQIENLLVSKIEEREARRREEQNFSQVHNKLLERFGPNYKTHLQKQMSDIGMSDNEVNKLAKENPKAFEKLFLPEVHQETFNTPPASIRRSDNFSPKTPKRDWAYYENMRKTNPTLYNQPKTQMQIIEDMKALGEDFG